MVIFYVFIYPVVLTRWVWKITEQVSQFIPIQIKKLHGFPFKWILCESNPRYHSSLSRLSVLLKLFFWDAPQLRCHSPLVGFCDFNTSLGHWKNPTEQDIKLRSLQYGNVPHGQELSDAYHFQSRYFSDIPKILVIIIPTLSFLMFSWLEIIQSTNDCHLPAALPALRSP